MSIQTAADKTSLYCVVLVLHQSSALDLLLTMTMRLPLPLLCLVTLAWTHRSHVSGSEGVGSPAGDGVYFYIIPTAAQLCSRSQPQGGFRTSCH